MKVSVVIPTYSRAQMLCEAIDSVLAQDFGSKEVIVIDDGSTDDTEQRARQYGDQIRYIRQSNHGLGPSRNRGLSLAKGEYIALLDDDDWWMPGKLELQVQVLDRVPNVSGVFTNFSIYRDTNDIRPNGIQTWYKTPMNWRDIMDRSFPAKDIVGDCDLISSGTEIHVGSIYEQSMTDYFVLPSTSLFRRSHLPDQGWFPDHDPICGDWDFFARMSKRAPLCFIDADTTFNRSHTSGTRLTQTRMAEQMAMRIDFLERVYCADSDFYASHSREVDSLLKHRLARLCLLQLLDSNREGARQSAARFRSIQAPTHLTQRLIAAAGTVPGGSWLMRTAQTLKRMI